MATTDNTNVLINASIAMGITGSIVGGTVTAIKDIAAVRKNEKTKTDAINNVLRESAGSGIAAAVGTASVGNLKVTNPILGGLSFAAVTIGTKYLWDQMTSPEKIAAREEEKKKTDNEEAPQEG